MIILRLYMHDNIVSKNIKQELRKNGKNTEHGIKKKKSSLSKTIRLSSPKKLAYT